jgi:uncharacterized protein YjeT (DUF2065 family)
MRKLNSAIALLIALATGVADAGAQTPTRIMVRVVARDAKIIGSGVGGARVTVVDAATGVFLAEGLQEGGTGDTGLIMRTPRARDMTVYDTEGAAGFLAELEIAEPTVVVISAAGPLGYPQAIQTASKQMLVVPGQHLEGDGVVLELHGFIVEILSPEPLTPVADEFDVRARVRGMCGCTIEPGGLWDASAKTVVAHLLADGQVVADALLRYAGQPSMFSGTLAVPQDARGKDLTVDVVVADASKQNFGRHEIPLAGER